MNDPPRPASPPSPAAPRPERNALQATKFRIPPLRSDLLSRPRLLDQLDQALASGLVLVSAPAGFGKSTLVAEWARASQRSVSWVSLDADDNDPVRFWFGVAAAIERAHPGLEEQTRPLLRAAEHLLPQAMVTTIVRELAARPTACTVVLDDYHLITSPDVQQTMALLLERLPPELRLVIVGRSDPPLPLARLRARGQLAELRAQDLRFFPQEAAELLRERWQLHLPAASVTALSDRTEGWVTGIRLLALALRKQTDPASFIQAFAGSHRFVLDYLTEDVLAHQPEAIRTFLLDTAILERFTAALCDAVTGRADGRHMLEALDQANLFLVPLDDERRWYRYHQLFADVLRVRLQEAHPERVAELHRRAAVWCRDHGLVHDALRHATAANEMEWAAELVEESVYDVLAMGEGATIRAWLAAVPQAVVRTRPRLCLVQAMAALNAGRLEEAAPLLEAAALGLNIPPDRQRALQFDGNGALANLPALALNLHATLALLRGHPEEAIGLAEQAGRLLTEEEPGPRLSLHWNLALAYWMRGEVVAAERALEAIVETGRATGSPHLALSAGAFLAGVQRSRANLGAALQTHRTGLEFASRSGHPAMVTAGTAHAGLAGVLYERNELDEANRHIEEGIALCRQLTTTQPLAVGLATLAWLRRAAGDPQGARAAMEEACRTLPSRDVVSLFNPVPAESARLLLALGDVAAAEAWHQERGLSETDAISYAREPEQLALARLLLARGTPERAVALLDRIGALAEEQGRTASVLMVSALRALGLHALGDRAAALQALTRALVLGFPGGYIRTFADEGPAMAALLGALLRTSRKAGRQAPNAVPVDYLVRVWQAARLTHGDAQATGLAEDLTDREREVLGMLAAGKRNQVIATELVVTLDTVKKHVTHTLKKLGAANRTEAVARARQLGLLP